ncbi:MAG: MOSC domain-containing protein [Cyanobacteria bacterium SID2]|nr:MOSC domain-containing protein [Cyanobacteria bacterium SID2]MBP0005008.1 MOSC domain-containing protein [Cyanobacteria bacterium SBC]
MRIREIFVHPVKGLSPQSIERVKLQENSGIVGDRAFGLMFVDTGKETGILAPWQRKQHFAVQNDWAGLAALACYYDFDRQALTVKRDGEILLFAKTDNEIDRERIGEFFTQYLQTLKPTKSARHPQHAPVRLVGTATGETRYPDRQQGHISIISQATFDELAKMVDVSSIDSRRFRPNFVVEDVPAWEEFNWVGHPLRLGGVLVEVTARIGRCFNINVNPETGEVDLPLFDRLPQHFKHAQTGVIAKVLESGTVAVGEALSVVRSIE